MPRIDPSLPPRVLVIDDDAVSRDLLAMLLEADGFPVHTAEDGRHAVMLLAMWSDNDVYLMPGLILMDTQMPGISGVELVKELRKYSPVPIVAISASYPGEAVLKATDGFLLKPISAEDVFALLKTDLPRKENSVRVLAAAEDEAGAVDEAVDSGVDPAVVGKLKAMMPSAAVREIYAAVADDLHSRLKMLKAAMDARNVKEVQRIAHAIKGGCSMVGVTLASEAASRLELSNLPVTWSDELANLHHALGALEGMLGGDFPA